MKKVYAAGVRVWQLIHKKTKEIKKQGSYRQCSIVWENLPNPDDFEIIDLGPTWTHKKGAA